MRSGSISDQLDATEALRSEGRRKIEWARQHMPILNELRGSLEQDQPFAGVRIGMAMHVEAKTAVLVETLVAGGADVSITGCNPLSTKDDVSVALDAQPSVTSYAKHGVDDDAYYDAIEAVIRDRPSVTVDDGGDLVFAIHRDHPDLIEGIVGGCEETTTGVHRLRSMAADGELGYPMFAVNDTPMKRLFDNVHGTGESALAAIALTTNLSWAGKTVVVAGYGYCGRGVAKKAAGQNARVVITEIDERRALEAHMEGFEVMPMVDAASIGDVFITTTGNRDVITTEDFEAMSDGVVLANAGHFDVEINLDELAALAVNVRDARDGVREYELPNGRRVNVLAEGRLVNLAAPIALGHPAEVMDQSFGMQTVAVRELIENASQYDAGVHPVPDDLDREVAGISLRSSGIQIDTLTEDQRAYLTSWEHGT